MPVPVRLTVCGEPEALSWIVTEPLRSPAAVGAKAIDRVQLLPAISDVPQSLACRTKSPLVVGPDVTFNVAEPLFVAVTACAVLALPTNVVGKLIVVDDSVTIGAGVEPD